MARSGIPPVNVSRVEAGSYSVHPVEVTSMIKSAAHEYWATLARAHLKTRVQLGVITSNSFSGNFRYMCFRDA